MSNSRKTIWIVFAFFMFIQMGIFYITNKNQDNLIYLMEIQGYIPYMFYFSLAGVVLFMLSFMVYQLDNIKANKQITQLEREKNELKAKLFDIQELTSKSSDVKPVPSADATQETKTEESSESDANPE